MRVALTLMVLGAGGLAAAPAKAAPVTIDFEDLPNGTNVTNQYQSRGVTFNNHTIAGFGAVHSGQKRLDFARSEDEFSLGPIVGTFTRAMTRVSLFSGSGGAAGVAGTLSAFDASGALVGRDGPKPLGGTVDTSFAVVATTARIVRFTFEQSPFQRPRIDDLTFDDGGCAAGLTPISGSRARNVDFFREAAVRMGMSQTVIAALTGSGTIIITKPPGGSDPGGSTTPEGTTSCSGSHVDNIGFTYTHDALDYATDSRYRRSGCDGCGDCFPSGDLQPGDLKRLEVKRIHRPDLSFLYSSFGPGVFGHFDSKLRIFLPIGPGDEPRVDVYDIQSDLPVVRMSERSPADGDNAVDGVFHDVVGRQYKDLRIVDQQGQPTPIAVGARAVLTMHSGERDVFEIISTQTGGGGGALDARFIRFEDRNGNAEVVGYVNAAAATDAQLGFDRTRLWQVRTLTDMYGVAATFEYGPAQVSGRWAVSKLTYPTGQANNYSYQASGAIGLTRVQFPDGTASTFTTSVDAQNQEIALGFEDNAAGEGHVRKTVFVTQSTIRLPSGELVNQPPNLVRRIVNGSGELVYRNWEDTSDPNTVFVYQGGQNVIRLAVRPDGFPISYARLSQPFNPNNQPACQPFQQHGSADASPTGALTRETDPLGRVYTLTRDPLNRAVTATTYRDGTTSSAAYNQLRDPTHVVDTAGAITDYAYDARGNLTTLEQAAGTPERGTIRWTRNMRGQPLSMSDARGNVTNYEYDAAGRLTAIIDPPDRTGQPRATRRYAYDSAGRTVTASDAAGRLLRYAYDARNRISTLSFADGSNEINEFGGGVDANLLTSKRDRNGNLTTFTYDAASRLVGSTRSSGTIDAISDSWTFLAGTNLRAREFHAGEETVTTYDERNREVAVARRVSPSVVLTETSAYDLMDRRIRSTDAYGRSTFFAYDAAGRVARTIAELIPGAVPAGAYLAALPRDLSANPGYTIKDAAFDAQGRLALSVDGRGTRATLSYDNRGQLIEQIVAEGTPIAAKTQYRYDVQGNRTREIRPRSFTEGRELATAYTYNARNLLETQTEAVGTSDASTTAFEYTPTRKKAKVTDGRGNATLYKYDDCCDRVTESTDPTGAVTRFAYDFNGNRTAVTEPNGNRTAFTYDGLNREVTMTNAAGEVTTTAYDDNLIDGQDLDPILGSKLAGLSFGSGADGAAVTKTNPAGDVYVTIVDPLGRQLRTIDGNNNATTTTYDRMVGGLLEEAMSDPLAHVTRNRRDGERHLRELVDAGGQVSRYTFDATGNQVRVRDPNGTGEDCAYDVRNRVTSCTDTQGDVIAHAYDAENDEVSKTDARTRVTRTVFDARNRKTSVTDRITGVMRFAYDQNNNLVRSTDQEGGATVYQFDARDLKISTTYPDGGLIRSTYDNARRLTSLVQQDGNTITYLYDNANRMVRRKYRDGTEDILTYDLASRLTQADSTRFQTSVRTAYDHAGRTTRETQRVFNTDYTVQYTYDAANRPTAVTYPSGRVVARAFTDRDQLASVASGGTTLASYTYDAGKRLTGTTLGSARAESRTYRADDLIASMNTPGVVGFDYTYDSNKRKLTESNRTSSAESQSFGYDDEDRLNAWSRQTADIRSMQLSLAGDFQRVVRNGVTETRTHNAVHETRTVNAAALSYDPKGNLTANHTGRALTWDFENQLTQVRQGGTEKGRYVYDAIGRRLGKIVNGVSIAQIHTDEQLVAEYGNGSLLREYAYGEYIDHPVAMFSGGAVFYFSANHLHSIAALTNSAGAVVERYRYDSHGTRTVLRTDGSVAPDSAFGNPFGFTGRYHDGESGLTYFRTRYYDGVLGRFISRDKEYVDGPNLYFAYFVPNRLDPTGRGWKIGFSGNADIELNFCKGGVFRAGFKGWAGAGYEKWGIFVGFRWTGEKWWTIAENVGFLDCGGACGSCCKDPYQPQGYASVGSGGTNTISTVSQALTSKLGFLGVKCGENLSTDQCEFGIGLDCTMNFIDKLGPVFKAVVEGLDALGVKLEAGIHIGVAATLCKTASGTQAAKKISVAGGGYIKIGVGV